MGRGKSSSPRKKKAKTTPQPPKAKEPGDPQHRESIEASFQAAGAKRRRPEVSGNLPEQPAATPAANDLAPDDGNKIVIIDGIPPAMNREVLSGRIAKLIEDNNCDEPVFVSTLKNGGLVLKFEDPNHAAKLLEVQHLDFNPNDEPLVVHVHYPGTPSLAKQREESWTKRSCFAHIPPSMVLDVLPGKKSSQEEQITIIRNGITDLVQQLLPGATVRVLNLRGATAIITKTEDEAARLKQHGLNFSKIGPFFKTRVTTLRYRHHNHACTRCGEIGHATWMCQAPHPRCTHCQKLHAEGDCPAQSETPSACRRCYNLGHDHTSPDCPSLLRMQENRAKALEKLAAKRAAANQTAPSDSAPAQAPTPAPAPAPTPPDAREERAQPRPNLVSAQLIEQQVKQIAEAMDGLQITMKILEDDSSVPKSVRYVLTAMNALVMALAGTHNLSSLSKLDFPELPSRQSSKTNRNNKLPSTPSRPDGGGEHDSDEDMYT